MPRKQQTFSGILEAYILTRDIEPDTETYYKRVGSVFRAWYGGDPSESDLTPELISRFLRDKQKAGRSSHYLKSLRNGLMAVLAEIIDSRKVRPVKLEKLKPRSWTYDDVRGLIAATAVLPCYKRRYYQRVVATAWHTGLAKNDLDRLTRRDVLPDGTVWFDRHKTGETVVVWMPPEILDGLPLTGPLFPRRWSNEQFRRDFKRVVQAAKLVGTFKKLRKTSGTEADIRTGKGHVHLANSRKVFEKHYLDETRTKREPVRLPSVLA